MVGSLSRMKINTFRNLRKLGIDVLFYDIAGNRLPGKWLRKQEQHWGIRKALSIFNMTDSTQELLQAWEGRLRKV